jgi:hypothetical protein
MDIPLGDPARLKLIGRDLPATDFGAGDTLPVTLYWGADSEIGTDYTVFLQLLDDDWQVVAQKDLQPQAGAAPTTTWLPGEIVEDPYDLPLPGDLAPGAYRLIAGMYDPATGQRMPVSTGGDFIDLGTVTIR